MERTNYKLAKLARDQISIGFYDFVLDSTDKHHDVHELGLELSRSSSMSTLLPPERFSISIPYRETLNLPHEGLLPRISSVAGDCSTDVIIFALSAMQRFSFF